MKKYILLGIFAIFVAGTAVVSCKKEKSDNEKGREAADKALPSICACIAENPTDATAQTECIQNVATIYMVNQSQEFIQGFIERTTELENSPDDVCK
jgi:hypothetical protein